MTHSEGEGGREEVAMGGTGEGVGDAPGFLLSFPFAQLGLDRWEAGPGK